jgi:hypothetical protein
MNLSQPQVFDLQLKPKSTYSVILDGGSRRGFTNPATLVCPKICVVTESKDIRYVGVTNRPMASRLNTGLKANGNGGYHGYKWKHLTKPLVLTVWSFANRARKDFLRELEAVEAEFAFLVRQTTDDIRPIGLLLRPSHHCTADA